MTYGGYGQQRRGGAASAYDDEEREPVDFGYLRREVDLPSLVARDTTLHHTRSGEYRAACPIHDGKNLSFRIWRDGSQEWHFKCYSGCNAGGDAITYLTKKDRMIRTDAIAALYRMARGGGTPTASTPHKAPARRPEPTPLTPRALQPMINCLDLPIDPSGKDTTTARDWWHTQGMADDAIEHFQLGYCPACPTAYDPRTPDRRFASATIPIWTPDQRLANIRHRLLRPPSKNGDKYRPHQSGLGAHLFNAASLTHHPDRTARTDKRIALIVEGEKKAMVTAHLDDWLPGFLYPIVSADAGVGAWLNAYGDEWEPLLWEFERVVVIFDPGPLAWVAEQTAARFGRAGCVLELPKKLDDWLLERPGERVHELVARIEDCRPLAYAPVVPGVSW